jgi:hypothetical protein
MNGYLDLARYLIEKCGADVNAKDHVSEFDQFVGKLSFDRSSPDSCTILQ